MVDDLVIFIGTIVAIILLYISLLWFERDYAKKQTAKRLEKKLYIMKSKNKMKKTGFYDKDNLVR